MKKYAVVYLLADHKDEEPQFMPDFVFNTKEEAQETCDNLNSVSPFFKHFIKEINID